MKISYNLLREFVKTNLPPEKLAQTVTDHSVEMEYAGLPELSFDGIVTAKVLEIKKHPNADRLRVVKADIGTQIIEPIVCGAFNFEAGDIVALALPGAKIAQNIHSDAHEPFVLGKAKIRGIESQGMICAAFELGLENEPGQGILILNKNTKLGLPLENVLSQKPAVFEVAVPANRPDLHSHWGLAREVGAILNVKFTEASNKKISLPKIPKKLKVEVKNTNLCQRYYGIKMAVSVGPSPEFLQELLVSLGLRPINNVVDITNLIMLELGQPTHAFDAAFIEGGIIVKTAKNGEKFSALNHKEYKLDSGDLVIADQKKTLALAGIIGGKESEVTERTKEIILEVANFQATGIRKTCRKLGIRTDGSNIWEKGVHTNLSEIGLFRAIELLSLYAGGTILDVADYKGKAAAQNSILFTAAQVNKLLGSDFKPNEIENLLARFDIKTSGSAKLKAVIPWWRADLATPEDLAEEVVKLKGYASVKPQPLTLTPRPAGEKSGQEFTNFLQDSKEMWARCGFSEAQNLHFVSEADILKFGGKPSEYLEVENPGSAEQRFIKRHLLIPLLKNLQLNQKNFDVVKLFEVGRQHLGFQNEPWLLTAVSLRKLEPAEKILSQLKGCVHAYLKAFGLNELSARKTDQPWLEIKFKDTAIGLIGLVQEDKAKQFDVNYPTAFIKLELDKIYKLRQVAQYTETGRFPSVQRDVSIIIPQQTEWQQIENLIRPVSNLVTKTELFEAPFLASEKTTQEYHKNLENKGLKNYGIRLTLAALDHTLTEAETTSILDKIVLKLKHEIKAEIR